MKRGGLAVWLVLLVLLASATASFSGLLCRWFWWGCPPVITTTTTTYAPFDATTTTLGKIKIKEVKPIKIDDRTYVGTNISETAEDTIVYVLNSTSCDMSCKFLLYFKTKTPVAKTKNITIKTSLSNSEWGLYTYRDVEWQNPVYKTKEKTKKCPGGWVNYSQDHTYYCKDVREICINANKEDCTTLEYVFDKYEKKVRSELVEIEGDTLSIDYSKNASFVLIVNPKENEGKFNISFYSEKVFVGEIDPYWDRTTANWYTQGKDGYRQGSVNYAIGSLVNLWNASCGSGEVYGSSYLTTLDGTTTMLFCDGTIGIQAMNATANLTTGGGLVSKWGPTNWGGSETGSVGNGMVAKGRYNYVVDHYVNTTVVLNAYNGTYICGSDANVNGFVYSTPVFTDEDKLVFQASTNYVYGMDVSGAAPDCSIDWSTACTITANNFCAYEQGSSTGWGMVYCPCSPTISQIYAINGTVNWSVDYLGTINAKYIALDEKYVYVNNDTTVMQVNKTNGAVVNIGTPAVSVSAVGFNSPVCVTPNYVAMVYRNGSGVNGVLQVWNKTMGQVCNIGNNNGGWIDTTLPPRITCDAATAYVSTGYLNGVPKGYKLFDLATCANTANWSMNVNSYMNAILYGRSVYVTEGGVVAYYEG